MDCHLLVEANGVFTDVFINGLYQGAMECLESAYNNSG